jgi:hypothetical protein
MIKEKKLSDTLEIDLTGEQGNVFYLIGTGNNLCRQLGLDKNVFQKRMMSSDYQNAIDVFEEYFGHIVTLYV